MMARTSTNQWMAILMTLVSVIALVCSQNSQEEKLAEKVTYLRDQSSVNPVLRFDGSKFNEYVFNSPRSYSVIVLFNALKRDCPNCQSTLDEFEVVANSFHYYSHLSSKQVFFVMLDVDDGMEVFQKLKINTAPNFYHFPAKGKPGKHDKMGQQESFHASVIAKWVGDRTDIKIKVFRPPNYKKIAAYLTFFAVVGGLIYLLRDKFQFNVGKTAWGFICLAFVFAMISGQMWNYITGPPMKSRDGVFIVQSSGSQTKMETYFVAFLYAAIVLGMMMVMEAADNKGSAVQRKLVAIVGICLVAFFFSLILAIVIKKGGYPYPFLLKPIS